MPCLNHRVLAIALSVVLSMALPMAGAGRMAQADTVSAATNYADEAPIAASRAAAPNPEGTPALHWFGHWDTDAVRNFSGGQARGGAIDSVAVGGFSLDGALIGLPHSFFTASVMGLRAADAAGRLFGTLTNPSNIEGDQTRLVLNTALWQQQWLQQPRVGLLTRVGLFDLNNEFDTTDAAAQLLNSSFGMDPAMTGNFAVSTFPLNGTSAVAVLGNAPDPDRAPLTLKIGLSQGEVNQQTAPFTQGVLNLVEGQWRPSDASALKLGAWRKRGQGAPNLSGVYLSAESILISDGAQSLEGFVRGSTARGQAENTAGVTRYFGAGLNWQAPLITRPKDTAVLGVGRLQQSAAGGRERFIEVGYIFHLAGDIYLQPDIQYLRPANSTLPPAWAGILRLHIE